MTDFATSTPAAHVRDASTAAAQRPHSAPGLAKRSFADVGQTLKYGARFLLKDLPLVARRSRALAARELDPHALHLQRQMAHLRRALSRASEVIPAYAALKGRVPRDGGLDFLRSLPIVDKATLLSERERYYPKGGKLRPWWFTGRTSGTTGTPLEVFRSYDNTLWEQAFHVQHWGWTGHPAGRQVVLRGDNVVPIDRSAPPYWFHDLLGRQLLVSTRHLNRETAPAIAHAVAAFGAPCLRAYPSAAMELARLTEELGLPVRFANVITGSEALYPVQRESIVRAFQCCVFDFYGMAERVAFGAECEHGRMHVHPEYSLVEIVDEHGLPTEGFGSIVGTSFHNRAMPLVRYRLTDRARWRREPCPCGRTYPTIELEGGKVEDRVFDLDGRAVSPSVITFAFKGLANIERSQVAQVAADQWLLRVVPAKNFSDADAQALLANLHLRVSSRLNVQLALVASIPNLPSGKFKWVSQESRAEEELPDRLGFSKALSYTV